MPICSNDVILAVKGLKKTFGDLVAVDSLSFEVGEGEIYGFLGPNGAGKTTTLNMICGLLRSDSGEIRINGLSLTDNYPKYKRMIGLCPQDLIIWDSLTCLEQLNFMARMYDIDKSAISKKSSELLEELGLARWKHSMARSLSGGLKRRLNIALAMTHEPQILILDEPQAGLDPQSRILVREKIQSLAKRKTVILTSHDMDEVDRLADRVAIIDYGQLLATDTPGRLKKHIGEGNILEIKTGKDDEEKIELLRQELPENLHYLRLKQGILSVRGVEIPQALPPLLRLLSRFEIDVEDIIIRQITLEDVFIALTGRGLRE